MRLKSLIVSVFVGLALAGCSSTRRDELPDLPVGENWSHPVGPGSTNIAAWWEQYEIPELNSVVQTARASNANLAILVQRIELARTEGRSQTAGSLPAANADTSLSAGKQRRRFTDFETESTLPLVGRSRCVLGTRLAGQMAASCRRRPREHHGQSGRPRRRRAAPHR